MDDIEKYETKGLSPFNSIEDFQIFLNKQPSKKDIKINKLANNSKYVPIGIIENKLDEYFSGLWQIKNFKYQVVANEIVGDIELMVFHPILKDWITRSGAGAVMIQQKRDSKDLTDINSKIKNTLTKDFPHLKAECLKNACKSLGVIFGRNLNRDYAEDYEFESLSDNIGELDTKQTIALDKLESSVIKEQSRDTIKKQIHQASGKKLDDIIKYLEGKQ